MVHWVWIFASNDWHNRINLLWILIKLKVTLHLFEKLIIFVILILKDIADFRSTVLKWICFINFLPSIFDLFSFWFWFSNACCYNKIATTA